MVLAPSAPSRLRVTSGPLRGATFPLIDGVTIGRSPGVDILVLAPGVRPRHAQIRESSAGCFMITTLDDDAELRAKGGPVRLVLLLPGASFELAGNRFEVMAPAGTKPQCEYIALRGEVPTDRTFASTGRHLRMAA
jgi:hypothetical protein